MAESSRYGQSGMTVVELLIVVVIIATVGMIAHTSYRSFRERSTINRAARVVAADISLTRSLAIRNRASFSMVADESNRSYLIRNGAGTVFRRREFKDDTDLRLTSLDVMTTGDSVTFSSRGLATAAFVQVELQRRSETRRVQANVLGRSRVIVP
jgi:prepilin-type N-terminal cleavage/methylation domain-containing protein